MTLSVPRDYDGACPSPLLMVLHVRHRGLEQEYLGLTALVEGRGVLMVAPDGTRDASGNAFWNVGIDACCNFDGSTPPHRGVQGRVRRRQAGRPGQDHEAR